MLSAVLRSEIAVKVSVRIMKTFVEMRRYLAHETFLLEKMNKLESVQIKGDIKRQQFEEKTERRSVIKGRVLMGKQLSQPVLDEKTWCKYNFMSDNNVYNQLLYWACKYLSASVHNFELKRKLLKHTNF